jgi:hypothetical protein
LASGIFLRRPGIDDAPARRDKWQLEHFGRWETPRRRSRQRPDDVDDAVPGLIVQLRWRTPELHGWKDVDLDLSARVLLDHFRPWRQHLGVTVGHRRQEVVQLEGDLRLGQCRPGDGRGGERRARSGQEFAARDSH